VEEPAHVLADVVAQVDVARAVLALGEAEARDEIAQLLEPLCDRLEVVEVREKAVVDAQRCRGIG
jgi:hypothetical protein